MILTIIILYALLVAGSCCFTIKWMSEWHDEVKQRREDLEIRKQDFKIKSQEWDEYFEKIKTGKYEWHPILFINIESSPPELETKRIKE